MKSDITSSFRSVKTPLIMRVMAVAAMCWASTPDAQSAIIYYQNFGNTGSGGGINNASLGLDWRSYNLSDNTLSATGNAAISNLQGAASISGNVNSLPAAAASTDTGWAYATVSTLFVTSNFPFDLNDYSNIQFSWNQANGSASSGMRVAVKVNGLWYASAQEFTQASNQPYTYLQNSNSLMTLNFTTNASAWQQILVAGSLTGTLGASPGSISLGPPASGNLEGTVEAFGLYSVDAAGNNRFDNFGVVATPVPEPATGLALALGSGAFIFLRRRIARRLPAKRHRSMQ